MPPLQVYELAPLPLSVTELPWQTVLLLLLIVTVGVSLLTVTVITPSEIQPSELVPVTLYVVLTVGDTIILDALEPLLQV
jgi:hypothetical protein